MSPRRCYHVNLMDKFLKCYRLTGALHRTSKSALSGERNSGVISPYNIRNKRNRVFRPFSLLHKTPLGCKCSCTATRCIPTIEHVLFRCVGKEFIRSAAYAVTFPVTYRGTMKSVNKEYCETNNDVGEFVV